MPPLEDTCCTRCGTCCKNGGPALHAEDAARLGRSGLDLVHLQTLRRGEMVTDNPSGEVRALECEVVRVRPAPGSAACYFYVPDQRGCAIYADRPAECRALLCKDTAALEAMYAENRLSRRALLPEGHALLQLLDEHDRKADPAELGRLAREVVHGKDEDARREAVRGIAAMLAYDEDVRALTLERAGLPAEALDFLFGRPLADALLGFGLRARGRDAAFRLTRIPT
ncbi:MAG: YkgJ family cysteine cluster protein [Desulfovibrionaceae bacterium]